MKHLKSSQNYFMQAVVGVLFYHELNQELHCYCSNTFSNQCPL